MLLMQVVMVPGLSHRGKRRAAWPTRQGRGRVGCQEETSCTLTILQEGLVSQNEAELPCFALLDAQPEMSACLLHQ